MEKIFNWISLLGGALGGFAATLFGGFDATFLALVILMVLDYLTGVIKGICQKNLSSEIGFHGILKKLLILMVVAAAVALESFFGDGILLREMVIMFYACNEGLSILENTATFLPYPQRIKLLLLQCREKCEESDLQEKEQ